MSIKILCIFSNILGNKIISDNLAKSIEKIKNTDVTYVYVDRDDYRQISVPKIVKLSNFFESAWIVSKKISHINFLRYDLIFICGYEFLLPIRKYLKSFPVIICQDTTPILARSLVLKENYSIKNYIKSRMLCLLYKAIYTPIYKKIKICLPLSSWCGQSLIRDFGVDERNVVPCYTSLDLGDWRPREKDISDERPVKLLFVGNDFQRKGGDDLLEMFSNYLVGTCLLTIVSSDPCLDNQILPDGVMRYKSIPHDKMNVIFADADIFVFPTKRDQFGLVVAEAMACGLPVIARNVGGISDVVKNGWNGYLLDYQSSISDFSEKIINLVNDRSILLEMGKNSRKLAENFFCEDLFDYKIHNTVFNALGQISLSNVSR